MCSGPHVRPPLPTPRLRGLLESPPVQECSSELEAAGTACSNFTAVHDAQPPLLLNPSDVCSALRGVIVEIRSSVGRIEPIVLHVVAAGPASTGVSSTE